MSARLQRLRQLARNSEAAAAVGADAVTTARFEQERKHGLELQKRLRASHHLIQPGHQPAAAGGSVCAQSKDTLRDKTRAVRNRQQICGGEPMLSHKFNIGDIVALKPAIKRNILGGIYQVTKQLPENQGELE